MRVSGVTDTRDVDVNISLTQQRYWLLFVNSHGAGRNEQILQMGICKTGDTRAVAISNTACC
jgi:hypothetical protein